MVLDNSTIAGLCINSSFTRNVTINITCNSSASNTSTGNPTLNFGIKAVLIALCAIVFVIGVPGNIMVSYVLGVKKRSSSNNGDAFVVCLAVADLMASFCVPLITIHDLVSVPHWYLGEVMCYLLTSLVPVTLIASSWALVLISVDRYRIISKPFNPELSAESKAVRIVMVWVIAIVMNIPFLLTLDTSGEKSCRTKKIFSPSDRLIIAICNAVVGWIIPALILAVVYNKITKQLRVGEEYHRDTQVVQQQIRLENRKVVRMFVVIVIIYLVSTTPFAVVEVIHAYIKTLPSSPSRTTHLYHLSTVYLVLPNITVLNSCINPLVYARMHKEINGHVKIVWKKIKSFFPNCRKHKQSSYHISHPTVISNSFVSKCETAFRSFPEEKQINNGRTT